MSRKRKMKLLFLDEWELEEQEAWFADMAKNGWSLEKLTRAFAVFVEAEPEEIAYRLEIATKNIQLEEEQIGLYEASGWEYVTSRRYVHVFREKAPQKAIEIHTDPTIQAETIEGLKKSIFRRGMVVILWALLGVSLQFSQFTTPSSVDFLRNDMLPYIFSIIVYFYLLLYMLRGMIHISRLMQKLKRQESLNHAKSYKTKQSVRKWSLAVFAIIVLGIPSYLWIDMSSQGEAYPEIPRGDLPVVTLAEVEDVDLTEVAYSTNGIERQRENHFAEKTSLFVPQQYILKQQFIIPDRVQGDGDYEPSITSSRFEAQNESVAKQLVNALKREKSLDGHQAMELSGYEEAWGFAENQYISIIARKGKTVFDISYTGDQPMEVLIRHVEDVVRSGGMY